MKTFLSHKNLHIWMESKSDKSTPGTSKKKDFKSAYLNGRDLGQTGQVFRIGDGGDELDGSDDGTGWAAESVSAGHAGAGGTGGVGVVQGGHREGARVTRVGVLHGDKRRPGVREDRKKDGGKQKTGQDGGAMQEKAWLGEGEEGAEEEGGEELQRVSASSDGNNGTAATTHAAVVTTHAAQRHRWPSE